MALPHGDRPQVQESLRFHQPRTKLVNSAVTGAGERIISVGFESSPRSGTRKNHLARHKKSDNGLAILKRQLSDITEIVGCLEHLALRLFFMVEVLLHLFRNR